MTAVRGIVVAVWVGGLAALTAWGETTPALVVGALATVAAGVLVGRWWVLLVPAGVALIAIAAVLVSPAEPGDTHTSAGNSIPGIVLYAAVVAGVLGLGVAARRLV